MTVSSLRIIWVPSAGRAQESWTVEVGESEVLDAAVLLNAISDNPRFNSAYRKVRKTWRALFAVHPKAQAALDRWPGPRN